MPKATRKAEESARKIVRERDGHRCQLCGRSIVDYPSSIHHRRPRGAGGSALLEQPSNLVRLCGDGVRGCHGWLEANRTHAKEIGWILPKLNLDVRADETPLLTVDGWMLLDDFGSRTPCAAPAEVGA